MRLLVCLALACCTTAILPGQTPAKREPPPGALHSVKVKGNSLYSADAIVATSGLKIGQRVSRSEIDNARKKLQDLEVFNNVAFEYRTNGAPPLQYDVTFEVTENQQLFPMRFERLGDPEAIRSYLSEHVALYLDRIPGTEGALHRYAAAVEAFAQQTDKSAKVRAVISNDDPQELTVLFTPNVQAPTISQVEVSGNKAVDTGAILRSVNSVAVGVPLSELRLKLIVESAIKPLYAAKGYPAVSFPKIEVVPSKVNAGVVVKVEIKDGPQFAFGNVRFRGKGLDEDEIRSTINFKGGQLYNAEQADNFRITLLAKMRRRGLLDANITYDVDVDEAKRAVNVTYTIVPGEAYHFAKLTIDGLDITTQPVIEKLWGEKPGATFNPEYPAFFVKKIQEQGLFDNLADITSDYSPDTASHTVSVYLHFKGGKSAEEKKREERQERERNGEPPPLP